VVKRVRTNEIWSIDDLELELRKLPGVRAAGFEEADDVLLVQLHVADRAEQINRTERTDQPVPVSASRIAARHSDRPVAVEVVRWRTAPVVLPSPLPTEVTIPAESELQDNELQDNASQSIPVVAPESGRARLLAVLAFPDTDELEVHLVLDGKRTIGRATASRSTEGAVQATLDAVRDLGTGVQPSIHWARAVDNAADADRQIVSVALVDVDSRAPVSYGMASGTSLIDAAARATLDALNRRLGRTR
jgi:hypothetical protein